MRYQVVATHEESYSIWQVVDTQESVGDRPAVMMGWDTESSPNAAWLAEQCCRRFNSEAWGTFTANMLPILGVVWRRFDTHEEAESFARWAEYMTENDERPCEAWVMGRVPETGMWEVKVRNW